MREPYDEDSLNRNIDGCLAACVLENIIAMTLDDIIYAIKLAQECVVIESDARSAMKTIGTPKHMIDSKIMRRRRSFMS